jgi:cytidylate kinase
MKENYIITIGRQLGSGGREIGLKLAESLGISFYDKELIRLASEKSGLNEKVFESADEKKRFNIFWGLFGVHSSTQTPEIYSGYYLSNETLFKIQSDVIRNLAENKSCLFVGRCADYILKEHPQLLSIFLNADRDDRIRRVMDVHGISEKQASERVDKTDKQRESYYNYFSSKLWGAAGSYHLCINTSVLGIEETTAFIRNFAEKRFRLRLPGRKT